LSHFGITAEPISLINDNMVVNRTIQPEVLSGADVIRAICEINGCFGTITNEGKFRYVVLSPDLDAGLFPSDTLYPSNNLYPQDINHDITILPKSQYINVKFDDWMSESITQLTIRQDDSDVGTTVGVDGNTYIISGNFLVFGKNATELRTIGNNTLSNMKNRYYKPCSVECIGNPLHEVGDCLRIKTQYRGIVTYILERELTGIQGFMDTYSAQGTETFDPNLNSISSQFKQLAGKVTQVKVDTDGLRVYVEDQLDSTVAGSYANITSQEIALKVSKRNLVDDLDEEIGSGITIQPDSIRINTSGLFTVDSSNFHLDATSLEISGTGGWCTIYDGRFEQVNNLGPQGKMVTIQNGLIVVQDFEHSNPATNIDGVSVVTHALSAGLLNISGTADIASLYVGGHYVDPTSYLQSSQVTGIEVEYGRGLALNAPGYNGWVHVGYQSSAVTIGNSGATLRVLGSLCEWTTITVDGQSYTVLAQP